VIDREPEIKAAYLYNFGRYVEWPATARSNGESRSPDFAIGVVGDSPVVAPLRTIAASKKVGGRAIIIRQFLSEKDFRPCQMLFVPAGQNPELVAAILTKARETATLVVGDEEGFAQKQGQIGFYSDQNNMKFEINVGAAEKAGLKISSKLLSLGRIVGEKQGN
jgi:YfiR/HmsC-like